jgi:hypothetical protein
MERANGGTETRTRTRASTKERTKKEENTSRFIEFVSCVSDSSSHSNLKVSFPNLIETALNISAIIIKNATFICFWMLSSRREESMEGHRKERRSQFQAKWSMKKMKKPT